MNTDTAFLVGALNYFKQAGYDRDESITLVDLLVKQALTAAKGMSKAERSKVVSEARKGKDIGKPGKNFDKVKAKARASGARDPEAVAAAAMWKKLKK